jgi:hypothetical protein
MKKTLLAIFSLFLSVQIFSQSITIRIGQHEAIKSNWTAWSSPYSNFTSVQEGQKIIQDILLAVDRRANFEIRTANIDNAAAVVYAGKRYILYNPNFINTLVRRTNNEWSAISVLAHEVGHHLEGHTSSGQGSNPAIELEADEFSGYALRRMGASLADAQSAMRLIATQQGTSTHPGRNSRLSAIEEGWASADRQMTGNEDVARNERRSNPVQTSPVPAPQRNDQSTRTSSSGSLLETVLSILGQILTSNTGGGQSTFVRNGLNVLTQVNNKWQVVGKLARTNNANFPYMIYDQSNTQLFVDRQGKIVNRKGQYLGLLRSA